MREFFTKVGQPLTAMIVLVMVTSFAVPAQAQSPGQEDLDRAVILKVQARSFAQLGEVIRLCESAIRKGLDPDHEQFAKELLAATRIQRGMLLARELLPALPPQHPEFPKIRQLAVDDLTKGLENDPTLSIGWLTLARLELLPGGNAENARKAIDQAVTTAAGDSQLRGEALVLRASIDRDPQNKLRDLTSAIEARPEWAMPYRLRGALYADLGEVEKALADLDKAIELEPNHALTWQVKGMILAKQERYEEALKCFEKVQQLAPEATAPLLEQARILGIQTKFEDALGRLNQVLEREPGNLAALMLRAAVLAELKRVDEALADLNRILESDPDFKLALRLKATLLVRQEKLQEAARTLSRLRELEPEDKVLLLQHGLIEMALGRPRKAIGLLTQFLEKEPNNASALIARGDCYIAIGKHAEALADFEKALPLAGDNATFLNNFAWLLCTSPDDQLRDGKRALELAEKACKLLEYKAAFALSTLAAAYAELGDFDNAIRWAEKAVELAEGEEKEHIEKELECYRQRKPFRERQDKPEAPEEEAPTSTDTGEEPGSEASSPKITEPSAAGRQSTP
ncbi:MAG: tetratricopeptide repeat protein [Thermoguttaceae bacterium]|nr:tetratricopeptide repeat protein [Thermoguttaceae bacterium]MDW8078736.1 tetratricopeptide repeat protein [Thermoguttaceae bacterium]